MGESSISLLDYLWEDDGGVQSDTLEKTEFCEQIHRLLDYLRDDDDVVQSNTLQKK